MKGRIVCSKAGRDKGRFLVLMGESDGFLLVSDGKRHTLANPKRKNARHLAFTKTVLEPDGYRTDKQLRRSLAIYQCQADVEEELYVKRGYD